MRTARRFAFVLVVGVAAVAAACTPPSTGGGGPTTTAAPTTTTTSTTTTTLVDNDNDGFYAGPDCNDANASIYPGAPDDAGDEIDQNCDGIDGTITTAVFVSTFGADTGTCGEIDGPCRQITQALSRAVSLGKPDVYVAGGGYAKFDVIATKNVQGGFGQNFQRGLLASGSVTATVTGATDASVGGTVGILAENITTATSISDLTVQA